MSYRPQVKQPNGQMVDIPLDAETVKGENVAAKINNIISGAQVVGNATNATNDGQGQNIVATYATKSELAEAGQFDPNGTYPNLTAGEATHAVKATQDAAGNYIQSTYATKAELNTKADQAALNGVINGTTPVAKATAADSATNATNATNAGYATSAGSATNATNATNDGLGRNIVNTYALKSEVGNDEFVTYYTIVNPSSLTDRIYFSYEASESFYRISDLARDMRRNYYSLEGGVAASGYWDGQIVVGLYVDKSTGIPGTLKAYCIGGTNLQTSTVTISSSNKLNTRAPV